MKVFLLGVHSLCGAIEIGTFFDEKFYLDTWPFFGLLEP